MPFSLRYKGTAEQKRYIDAAEYPVDGTIALIVAFIFVAAGSRVARDLLPAPKDSQ